MTRLLLCIQMILVLQGCSCSKSRHDNVIRDTIRFSAGNFKDVFGNLALLDINGNVITRFDEGKTYHVKLAPRKLKLSLVPLTKNVSIAPKEEGFNEFVIKSKYFGQGTVSEAAVISFQIDILYNQPIIIRRDYSKDSSGFTETYLDGKEIGTLEMKIKNNVD